MVSAVIVAGGKGRRMGLDINKVYYELAGREILAHTLAAFEKCAEIDEIVVVTGEADIERCWSIVRRDGIHKVKAVTAGGAERSDSVYNGLRLSQGGIAAIHDGARCLITAAEISAVIADAKSFGAAALGVTVKDTLKSIDENGMITGTIDRERTVQIQTPQVFERDEIMRLHEAAQRDGLKVTDDCSIFEHYGKGIKVTKGSYENIKITTPEDISVGERILALRRERSEKQV